MDRFSKTCSVCNGEGWVHLGNLLKACPTCRGSKKVCWQCGRGPKLCDCEQKTSEHSQ